MTLARISALAVEIQHSRKAPFYQHGCNSEDLPVTLSVIDTEEKIRRALPALQEMVSEGLVAMTDVEVLNHISGARDGKI